MRCEIAIIFCFLSAFAIVSSRSIEERVQMDNPLLIVTPFTLSRYLTSYDKFFVFMHSPWCKWSQKLESDLLKINKHLRLESQSAYIGVIDHTLENYQEAFKDAISQGLFGNTYVYPELIFIEKGQRKDVYKGRLDFNTLYLWIKRKLYPETVSLKLMDTYEYKIKYEKKTLIYFSREKQESEDDFLEIFRNVSRSSDDFMFYHTNDEEIIQKLNTKESSMIYFNFGNYTSHFEKEFSRENVESFVKGLTYKTYYDKFDDDVIENSFIRKRPTLFFLRNRYINTTLMFERKRLPQVVKKFQDSLQFVTTDIDGKKEARLAKLFELNSNDLPTARIVDWHNGNMRVFSHGKVTNSLAFIAFINGWKSGQLSPENLASKYKTNAKDDKEKEIFIKIPALSRNEKIKHNRKNVLVFYYTNWCALCKKIKNALDIVAKKLTNSQHSFFKVEVEENHIEIEHPAVPVIELYTIRNKDRPIIFNGGYNFKEIFEFVTTNSQREENKEKSDL